MNFFFFKQKTAYEMRISDWSSDVCSSDLHHLDEPRLDLRERLPERGPHAACDGAGGPGAAHADGGGAGLHRAQRARRHGAAVRLRAGGVGEGTDAEDRKSTRLNSSH